METEILLNITDKNMAEAEFMSANFIDNEIKKRAFINTLGAEAGITYLANNGINTEELRNLHSIKRVLEKTNLADIILPNIYIDVRVVFDQNAIFVPKSHTELGIEPDVYMVLKFNYKFDEMEFLGYFTPDTVNKNNANDDYYFVDFSEIKQGTDFIDYVRNFDGNTDRTLSEYEILRGRELAVLTSDDDITTNEYKEFLQLLKSSLMLRDSVLEYDNFETLAGSVANYMHSSNYKPGEINDEEETSELEASEELDVTGLSLPLDEDPNGDSLIDDDTIQGISGLKAEDTITVAPDIADTETDSGITDKAIQLAGLAGEMEPAEEPTTAKQEGLDIGTADFDLEEKEDTVDNMDIDLFDSIDTSGTDFGSDNDIMSSLESGFAQSADDIEFNQIEFGESNKTEEKEEAKEENREDSEFEMISEFEETPTENETTPQQTEKQEDSEDLSLNDEVGDLLGDDSELEDLELNTDDLSGWEEENPIMNEQEEDLLELPTEEATAISEDSLSLEADDLLDNDLNLGDEDLLTLDDVPEEELENLTIDDTAEKEEQKNDNNELMSLQDDQNITTYESDNTEVSSFENYNPIEDEQSGNIGVQKADTNEEYAESFDFADLETETTTQAAENSLEEQQNSEEIYDFADFSEITEEPSESADNLNVEDVDRSDNKQTEDFEDLENFEELSESNAEISNNNSEEIIITDEFLNNSVVLENSTIISDKDFEPGEILLDINRPSLPDFENDELGDLYNRNEQQSGLNNSVRIGSLKDLKLSSIPPKYGVAGLLLIILTAGVILFSVSKMTNKNDPAPVTGSLNPEHKKENTHTPDKIDPDNIVMNDETGAPAVRNRRKQAIEQQQPEIKNTRPPKPIPPTSFLTVKKMSWEVPDYVSYNAEFRQFFQSSGKSLKTALNSDLLLATDYTYSNVIKLSITFDKTGKFKDAKIITSSGSDNVDKIVLQSVNQTLNILKAPNSVANDENTTVILKIYL